MGLPVLLLAVGGRGRAFPDGDGAGLEDADATVEKPSILRLLPSNAVLKRLKI